MAEGDTRSFKAVLEQMHENSDEGNKSDDDALSQGSYESPDYGSEDDA